MTTEQARTIIWSKIVENGVADTATQVGKTERALRYFAAGGLLGKDSVNELAQLFPDVEPVVWLAVLGVETPAEAHP